MTRIMKNWNPEAEYKIVYCDSPDSQKQKIVFCKILEVDDHYIQIEHKDGQKRILHHQTILSITEPR